MQLSYLIFVAMPTLFLGLGPRGDISEKQLLDKLEQIGPVEKLRYRSTCAFCDVARDVGEKVIKNLNATFIGSTKISVNWEESRPIHNGGVGRDGVRREKFMSDRRDASRDESRRDYDAQRRPRRDADKPA